jgi:hypothetical protein
MFEDLRDSVSFLFSWRWPSTRGIVTEAITERIVQSQNHVRYRLAVAYKFSVGDDGPYTGEGFWEPSFFSKRRTLEARRRVRSGHIISVRYRTDDPSINKPDSEFWNSLTD